MAQQERLEIAVTRNGEGAARPVRLWRTDRPESEDIQRLLANGAKRGKTQGGFGAPPVPSRTWTPKNGGIPPPRSGSGRLLPLYARTLPPFPGVTLSLWMKYDEDSSL